MGRTTGGESDGIAARVEKALRQCVEWSRLGQHRKVVKEVDRQLQRLDADTPHRPGLLIWKAQAMLAMGLAEEAHPVASQSWDLDPSPHACHLNANALEALGDLEGAEELLRMGWRLFPGAVHLPVQLAVTLADQGRHPEALDVLDEVSIDSRVPEDLQVFLFGMRSNLLASMGRWAEADETLRNGIDRHPSSDMLCQARSVLIGARKRTQARKALAKSWSQGLTDLEGSASDVDEAVIRCGTVNEMPEIVILAARRLWRAFLENRRIRVLAPDAWGVGLVNSVLELDGESTSIAALAASVACSPSSVRKVVRRLRDFLDSLEPEFARRAFAATTNPRLDGGPRTEGPGIRPGVILPFPTP